MSRNTKIVAIVAASLIVAVAVLAWLSRDYILQRQALQESGTFIITAGGEQHVVTMSDLEAIGPSVIDANYKTNLMPAEQKKYTGVPLAGLLEYLGVDCSDARSVSFSASDGYVTAASIADAMDSESCFIVFLESGKPLGTRESGGIGPYMVIFASDRFSQRWCKYLLEIAVR